MKKLIYSWGLMLAAAFTLTNCAQELDNPVYPGVEGAPFEILVSTPDTKTVNDGMATNWAKGDKLNVFHAVGETSEYTNNNAFEISDLEKGKFTGELSETLDVEKEYDWFAFYPYSSYIKTPANTSAGYMPVGSEANAPQIQNGNNSMAHIAGPNYPLSGYAVATPANAVPKIPMSHVTSLLEINVTNDTEEPLKVEDVVFTAPVDVVGTFYINFTGDITSESFKSSGEKYVSKSANLKVTNGEEIAVGASAKFYLAVKPYTAAAGETLTINVNGYSKDLSLEKAVSFAAGKIKKLNFSYDYEAPVGEQSVTFDFTSADELDALGLTLPEVGNGTAITTVTKSDITFVADGGSITTRLWNSDGKYDLRAYKGATLTFSVPRGYVIHDVILTGKEITSISKSVLPSNPVVLAVDASADTQKISTITVKYAEGEVVAVPLTMGAVACINQTSNSLTFSWDEVSGAEGYKVSLNGGNTWSDQFDATSYTWENLDSESEYTIYVKAVGNGINTLDSEVVSANGTTEVEQADVVISSTEFTFTGSNGQKDFTVMIAPIKIAFAKGTGSNAPYDHSDKHIRFYTDNTMTFTGGTIVKIELKYSNTSYPGTGTAANVGTLSQNTNTKMWTWIGKATTVTLTGGSKQGRYDSITVYYESDGTLPDPVQLTMSNVTCSAQTANSLTFKWDAVDGATGYEVSFDGDEAETITETTYTAEGLDPDTEYEISVRAIGDGTYYLTSAAKTCSETTTSASIAPSGNTYTKYTGTLVEGDYIIVYQSYAMTASVSSSRFTNTTISPSDDTITNPDATIVWHIAKSGDYWTIYNEGVSKYAASTGAKNKAQLLASGTDDKSLWTVTGTTTYEFVNKQNKANGVNSNLRNNGTYGFACYATATGGALTLYKKN